MKKYVKMLALFLAIVMLVTAFASCGGKTPEETTEKTGGDSTTQAASEEISTEDEWKPDIEQKNYGKEFYLNILPDVNPTDFYWVKESNNTTLTDAIYNRQEKIRDYLGVEIVGIATEGENRYVEPFKNAVKTS